MNWTLEQFVGLPKCELHVHLEGALRPERALALAGERPGHPWHGKDLQTLQQQLKPSDFQGFIDNFKNGVRLLRSAEAFYAATNDLCQDLLAMGVRHAEILYSPGVSAQILGVPIKAIHDGIASGLAANPQLSVVMVIDTVLNLGLPFMTKSLQLTMADARPFIGGFSVGGGDPELDMTEFLPLFQQASDLGLACVAHVGEVDAPGNIRCLLEQGLVQRIAHGLSAVEDPEVLALLCHADIAVDVSPTSNIFTGRVLQLDQHPARTFLDRKIPITINTDDPFYFQTNLYREYQKAAEAWALQPADLLQIMANSWRYALLEDAQKAEGLTALSHFSKLKT